MRYGMLAVDDETDPDVITAAMAERADGGGRCLIFQARVAGEFDEQDGALGLDRYCVSTESSACVYGGLLSCAFAEGILTLHFSSDAAETLGLAEDLRCDLRDSAGDRDAFLRAFRAVVAIGPATSRPVIDL